jgi:hypothetical protein
MVDNFDMSGQLPEWEIARGKTRDYPSDLGLKWNLFRATQDSWPSASLVDSYTVAFTVGFDSLV